MESGLSELFGHNQKAADKCPHCVAPFVLSSQIRLKKKHISPPAGSEADSSATQKRAGASSASCLSSKHISYLQSAATLLLIRRQGAECKALINSELSLIMMSGHIFTEKLSIFIQTTEPNITHRAIFLTRSSLLALSASSWYTPQHRAIQPGNTLVHLTKIRASWMLQLVRSVVLLPLR